MNNIIWWCAQKLGDNGELVDVIFSGEKWFTLQHLCENTSRTPDIDLNVILLPCKHDLWCSVISRRDVSGHLRILDTGKTEIADFEIAILIDENIAGLEITMNNTCRVDIFETTLASVSCALMVDGTCVDIRGFGRGSIG